MLDTPISVAKPNSTTHAPELGEPEDLFPGRNAPSQAAKTWATLVGVAVLFVVVDCILTEAYAGLLCLSPALVSFLGGAMFPPAPFRVALGVFALLLVPLIGIAGVYAWCFVPVLPLLLLVLWLGAFCGGVTLRYLRNRPAKRRV